MEIHLVLNTGMITTGGKFEASQINEEESKVNLVKVWFNKATACEVFSNICHLFILPETTWMVWTVVHNYELRNTWLYFLRNKLCIFIFTTSISDGHHFQCDTYSVVILNFNVIFMLSSINKQRNKWEAVIFSTTSDG